LKRPYNIETAISVQHALTSRVAVTAGWYHRSFHNIAVIDNLLRSPADYVPVAIVSPYNGDVITAYNLKSAALLSQVDNLVTNGPDNLKEIYNGFELSASARLPGGGQVLASSTTQRILRNHSDGFSGSAGCADPDDPNTRRFCDRFNLPAPYQGVDFKSDFKLAGSYPLPFGIRASGTFKSHPARPRGDFTYLDEVQPINWNISRTTRYTAEGCAGRPCTAGDLVIPGLVQTSLIVPLAPAGTEVKLPRLVQLDFGATKTFRRHGVEMEGGFQLFNALNASTVVQTQSTNFGTATYGVPSEILLGRFPRISLQMKW